jgi:hypothetical protein
MSANSGDPQTASNNRSTIQRRFHRFIDVSFPLRVRQE